MRLVSSLADLLCAMWICLGLFFPPVVAANFASLGCPDELMFHATEVLQKERNGRLDYQRKAMGKRVHLVNRFSWSWPVFTLVPLKGGKIQGVTDKKGWNNRRPYWAAFSVTSSRWLPTSEYSWRDEQETNWKASYPSFLLRKDTDGWWSGDASDDKIFFPRFLSRPQSAKSKNKRQIWSIHML